MSISKIFLQEKGVKWILSGATFFIAENLILSENREKIISHFSDDIYHNIYNFFSLASTASILFGYFRYGYRKGPIIQTPNYLQQFGGFSLQFFGFGLLSQSFPSLQIPFTFVPSSNLSSSSLNNNKNINNNLNKISSDKLNNNINNNNNNNNNNNLNNENKLNNNNLINNKEENEKTTKTIKMRCPIDFGADIPQKGTSSENQITNNIQRVTRHPSIWGLSLSSLGASITAFNPTSITFFFIPTLIAFSLTFHADSRYRRNIGGYLSPEMDKKTSNIPFWAIIRGEQSFSEFLKNLKGVNLSLAFTLSSFLAFRRFKIIKMTK